MIVVRAERRKRSDRHRATRQHHRVSSLSNTMVSMDLDRACVHPKRQAWTPLETIEDRTPEQTGQTSTIRLTRSGTMSCQRYHAIRWRRRTLVFWTKPRLGAASRRDRAWNHLDAAHATHSIDKRVALAVRLVSKAPCNSRAARSHQDKAVGYNALVRFHSP